MSRSIQYTASPLLTSRTPVWRSKFIVGALALGFVGLGARAAYIQVFNNDFFQHQGEVRYNRTLELPANRGRILDRNGLILASSVPAPSIWAIPEDVSLEDGERKQLAKLLGIPEAELAKKLADEDKSFVWLKRQIDPDNAKKIAELNFKGIYQRTEYRRQYPEGEAAAHVVGFTNVEDKGQEGVELLFNSALLGRAGSRHVIKDRLGHAVEQVGETVQPEAGKDVQLSIDTKVQFFAYQKLRDAVLANRAQAGSIVVLDALTGEVLALANYPSYDPEKRVNLTGAQLRNRALTDTFEPGSVMKPFTIGLALNTGRVKTSTIIDTAPGSVNITGATIRDAHPHGALTVEQVIQVSSNVGTTKIAMQMPATEMWETFSSAGFGQKPQIEFPGAVSGRLRPGKTWRPIEQATASYGYGLSASLFQMVRSYTVFSHDGQIIPATLLKNSTQPAGVPVFTADTAAKVRKMLQMA
ncbi:MAG: peptidoglycan D,D-transpeptidase FtsI family protein, partial [Rhodoferax sp.]